MSLTENLIKFMPVRHALLGLRFLIVCVASISIVSCSQTKEYKVGDLGPAGGVIYYVAESPFACGPTLREVCEYIEAAPADSDVLRKWSDEANLDAMVYDATATKIGSGLSNTRAVVAQGNIDPLLSAAAYADAYEFGGYSDWFVPSKDEIYEFYVNASIVKADMRLNYWSSSSFDLNTSWNQSFSTGYQYRTMKFDNINVRPVRAF